MPKKEILEMCEQGIRNDLGSLDDLPNELANTVANIYYRYFNHVSEVMRKSSNNPGWIPKEMKQGTNMAAGMNSFIENSASIMSDFKAAPKFIASLRGVDKRSDPNLYQSLVDFALDCLKYNIKDAHKKIGLRRMIERKFCKDNVHEIPNLLDLMDI